MRVGWGSEVVHVEASMIVFGVGGGSRNRTCEKVGRELMSKYRMSELNRWSQK